MLFLIAGIDLQVDDKCYFYNSQAAILKCTVKNTMWSIIWRKNSGHVSIGGILVGPDRDSYNISTFTDEQLTIRVETLYLSRNITMSALTHRDAFLCSNQGFQSRRVTLRVPGELMTSVSSHN